MTPGRKESQDHLRGWQNLQMAIAHVTTFALPLRRTLNSTIALEKEAPKKGVHSVT